MSVVERTDCGAMVGMKLTIDEARQLAFVLGGSDRLLDVYQQLRSIVGDYGRGDEDPCLR